MKKKILIFEFYACFVYLMMENLNPLRQIVGVGSMQSIYFPPFL